MIIDYYYYVAKPFSKPYIVTVAREKQENGEIWVGVAYQGKKDGYNKEEGYEIAINRMNRNPKVLNLREHYNLNSAIVDGMPMHIKRCVRIFDKEQYNKYYQKAKKVESKMWDVLVGKEKDFVWN